MGRRDFQGRALNKFMPAKHVMVYWLQIPGPGSFHARHKSTYCHDRIGWRPTHAGVPARNRTPLYWSSGHPSRLAFLRTAGVLPSVAMKTTPTLLTFSAISFLIVSATVACRSAKDLLPPRYVVDTEQEARALGWPQTVAVAGTGSMKPYIPGSPNPDDIVAIAAVECPPYEALKKGDLVIYRWKGKRVIHQIVARQGKNWITAGLNNSYYDGPVVSRETFLSRVKQVYVLAQASKRLVEGVSDAQSLASPFAMRKWPQARRGPR